MSDDIRPIPGDNASAAILEFISVDQTWLLSYSGDFETCAVEVMTDDGGSYQQVIALKIPVRRNKTQERSELRLMLSPEMAFGLAQELQHTSAWLVLHNARQGEIDE